MSIICSSQKQSSLIVIRLYHNHAASSSSSSCGRLSTVVGGTTSRITTTKLCSKNTRHLLVKESTTTTGKRTMMIDSSTNVQQRPLIQRGVGLTVSERSALRESRKQGIGEHNIGNDTTTIAETSTKAGATATAATAASSKSSPKYIYVGGVAVLIGLGVAATTDTGYRTIMIPFNPIVPYVWPLFEPLWISYVKPFFGYFTDPSHEKLLPNWSDMPNVPHDIPIPHTLVLDLEKTLISTTWDRKYGWRHSKRPGVDKFLHDMAQYYEIVLYTPTLDSIAEPVVAMLDKDGCIMHRLYRDATLYKDGVHIKDLDHLNRNLNKMIVLDDDPNEVQLHPYNLIRVKPYEDATDLNDNTLERITPFLIEIAREGYDNIPELLYQYYGMDADEIANEQERRIQELYASRQRSAQRGLGRLVGSANNNLPEPELPPLGDSSLSSSAAVYSSQPQQLTAKDIAGAAPGSGSTDSGSGISGWMARRAKEKEEAQMRKMELWNETMMKRQREKQQQQQQQQQQ